MTGLFWGTILFLACYFLGARVLNLLRIPMEADETLVIGAGIGLAFWANLVTFLGLFGLLNAAAFWIGGGVLLAFLVFDWRSLSKTSSTLKQIYALPASFLAVFFIIIASIVIFACLMGVLSPEIANDSLCYHLHLPKIFLREGRFFLAPYELNTMYPILMEMLYTFGLGLSGVTLAKFFHFGMGILATLTVFTWTRHFSDKKVAWGCALLFLSTPCAINEMGVTYVDVGLSFFTLLLMFSIWRWKMTRQMQWLVIGGVFAGVCIAIKYLGLIVWVLTILILFVDRTALSKKARGIFVFFLASMLSGGFWYVRNFIVFRNPVFPYLPQFFGTGDPILRHDYVGIGVAHTIQNFFALPWIVTMRPELFGGWGEQIGPGYLTFLPLLLAGIQGPFLGGIFLFVISYLGVWFLTGQMLRFLLPIIPILAVLLGAGWTKAYLGSVLKKILAFSLCCILLAQTLLAVYHYRKNFAVALGLESQENFLLHNERSYRIAKFVNENLAKNAKIFMADETHLYYFERSLARDVFFARTNGLDRSVVPEQIMRQIRQKGFTHILYTRISGQDSHQSLSFLSICAMIENGVLKPFLRLLHHDDIKLANGEEARYELYEII